MPLLYYNDVALLGYGPTDPRIDDRVQDAVYRIVDMQLRRRIVRHVGALLHAGGRVAADLRARLPGPRAREQQMAVPSASLQRGLSWLNSTADKFSPNAQAYAWYVLAKSGFADPGRVRYFQDTKAAEMKGGIAWAHARRGAEPGRRTRTRAASPSRLRASASTSATRPTITARRCATAPPS